MHVSGVILDISWNMDCAASVCILKITRRLVGGVVKEFAKDFSHGNKLIRSWSLRKVQIQCDQTLSIILLTKRSWEAYSETGQWLDALACTPSCQPKETFGIGTYALDALKLGRRRVGKNGGFWVIDEDKHCIFVYRC